MMPNFSTKQPSTSGSKMEKGGKNSGKREPLLSPPRPVAEADAYSLTQDTAPGRKPMKDSMSG